MLWTQTDSITHGKTEYEDRRVMRLVERTTQPDGVEPDYELEGWWTSLDDTPRAVIQRYQSHATHEQLHSDIKTDLDLEPLPLSKFATNDLILHLAQLAYHILRLWGLFSISRTRRVLLITTVPIIRNVKRRVVT